MSIENHTMPPKEPTLAEKTLPYVGLVTVVATCVVGAYALQLSTQGGKWYNHEIAEATMLGLRMADYITGVFAAVALFTILQIISISAERKQANSNKKRTILIDFSSVASALVPGPKTTADASDVESMHFWDSSSQPESASKALELGVIKLRTDYEDEKEQILTDLDNGYFSRKIEMEDGLWIHFCPEVKTQENVKEVMIFETTDSEFILKPRRLDENRVIGCGTLFDRVLKSGVMIKIMDKVPDEPLRIEMPLVLKWRRMDGSDFLHQKTSITADITPGTKVVWIGNEEVSERLSVEVNKKAA